MDADKKGIGVILHSGSYDRIYHGLSIGIAAAALGREARFFFSYWALEYLKKDSPISPGLDNDAQAHKEILEKNIKEGHMLKLNELLTQARAMGVKFYTCTNSMGLLNISRDELIKEVDKSMGITAFLTETKDNQLIFI